MPLRHETNRRLLLLIATVPAVIVGFVCYALAYAGYLLGTRLDSDPRLRDVMHLFGPRRRRARCSRHRVAGLAALPRATPIADQPLGRPKRLPPIQAK